MEAAKIYREVCDLYGIEKTFSMSRHHEMEGVARVLGERIEFIGMADYHSSDLKRAITTDYQQHLKSWAPRGMRIAKFWVPPRTISLGEGAGDPRLLQLNNPLLKDTISCIIDLGMKIMVHVADPDVWFKRVYSDSARFGTKDDHYQIFEEFLSQLSGQTQVIMAHMGGSPEDLGRLDRLLGSYSNLYLDTSATKWVVRELGKHPKEVVAAFFNRWSDRLLFGSDIVSFDQHLYPGGEGTKAQDASSPDEAFQLYASRYWALRTLLERDYNGPSPIADPDHENSESSDPNHPGTPNLVGSSLGQELLAKVYRVNALSLLKH